MEQELNLTYPWGGFSHLTLVTSFSIYKQAWQLVECYEPHEFISDQNMKTDVSPLSYYFYNLDAVVFLSICIIMSNIAYVE